MILLLFCLGGQYGSVIAYSEDTIHFSTSVWPGDANHDGTVLPDDILPIAQYYNTTGIPRNIESITWAEQQANPWFNILSNGYNLNNTDCNGDGIISSDDTIAVNQNMGSIWGSKSCLQTKSLNSNMSFTLESFDNQPGDSCIIHIIAGSSTIPLNNIFGIYFDINIDSLISNGNLSKVNQSNSWLGNQKLKIDWINGSRVRAAQARLYGSPVSGYGEIGKITFYYTEAVDLSQPLNIVINEAYSVTPEGDTIIIGSNDTASITITTVPKTEQNFNISVYPVPANEILNISLLGNSLNNIFSIETYNITGVLMDRKIFSDKEFKMNFIVAKYPQGIYFLKITGNNYSSAKKILIIH